LSTPFGLHPNLPELQSLFGQKKAAIVAMSGHSSGRPRRRSTRPATGRCRCIRIRPAGAMAELDLEHFAGTGWGGRLADSVASYNAASGFPVIHGRSMAPCSS